MTLFSAVTRMNFGETSLFRSTHRGAEAIPPHFGIDPPAQFVVVDEQRKGAPWFETTLGAHGPVIIALPPDADAETLSRLCHEHSARLSMLLRKRWLHDSPRVRLRRNSKRSGVY
jgi:hypothetical protein